MQKVNILSIGELKNALPLINERAQSNGINSLHTAELEKAIHILSSENIEIVFIDAEIELAEYFTKLNQAHINVETVVVGKSQPVSKAVKAIRLGAMEYLATPLDKKQLEALIEKIIPQENDNNPISNDPLTSELLENSKRFAKSNASILLRGESGTGKEVFSKYIHNNSKRSNQPFISINCAAIPENLLESELFGHEKGAFSGAINKRIGKFQQANGGTLLLDEISEMDISLQAKLLRAIQERVIDPVGASEPVSVDIRLIATTNRDLEQEVAEGKFREDLYFRLNVVMLEIPALRERTGDIEPLSRHFEMKYSEAEDKSKLDISLEAIKKLTDCYWKGNVRELENTIHRAVLMMGDETLMQPEHIVISPMSQNMMSNINQETPSKEAIDKVAMQAAVGNAASAYGSAGAMFESGTGATASISPIVARSVHEVERELILNTLDYCQGNRTHAADILGISIRTLRNKLNEYKKTKE